jgi:hypothetical protein
MRGFPLSSIQHEQFLLLSTVVTTLLVLGKLAGLELWGTVRGEQMALVRHLGDGASSA